MRYGYATVALPTLTPQEAGRRLSESGFQGVEWKVGDSPHTSSSDAAEFLAGNLCTLPATIDAAYLGAEVAREHGLSVIGLAPYIETGDTAGFRHLLRMAVAAGAPQIRLQGPRFATAGSYSTLRDDFSDFLRWAVVEAEPFGVRIALELHHRTIMPSVGLAMPILKGHDPERLGVIYDVGNLVYEGFEDYRIGLELLDTYLHHVHIKNASAARDGEGNWAYRWAPLDDGLVDLPYVLRLLHEHGYEGWVSVEDLTAYASSDVAIRHNSSVLTRIDPPGWRSNAPVPLHRTHLS